MTQVLDSEMGKYKIGDRRARGNINQIKLNMVHCPKHYKEAYDSLRDIGQIASTGSSKK